MTRAAIIALCVTTTLAVSACAKPAENGAVMVKKPAVAQAEAPAAAPAATPKQQVAVAETSPEAMAALMPSSGADKHAIALSGGINDPIEPVNRAIFGFNNLLDVAVIEPAAKVYNAVLPDFVRSGVQNFMRNLRAPITVANSLLQGDISGAGVTTARFVINTTAGIGGLVDVAATQGLNHRQEDFGQTMGLWGMGEGFYLVLPILGPSSLRDVAGLGVDSYADPLRIWSFKTGRDWIYYTRNGVEGLDQRARIVSAVQDLRSNSLDYYAAVRSAYTQKRRAEVGNANDNAFSIPDYDEQY